jgi:hypothetical protein
MIASSFKATEAISQFNSQFFVEMTLSINIKSIDDVVALWNGF